MRYKGSTRRFSLGVEGINNARGTGEQDQIFGMRKAGLSL